MPPELSVTIDEAGETKFTLWCETDSLTLTCSYILLGEVAPLVNGVVVA